MANTYIRIRTTFDITPTGTKGQFNEGAKGIVDKLGNSIDTQDDWIKSRNKQRNWETLQQVCSLRCQMFDIRGPQQEHGHAQDVWLMQFVTEVDQVFAKDGDPLGLLKEDCHGVPMIIGLDESDKELMLTPFLIAKGEKSNIVFEIVDEVIANYA